MERPKFFDWKKAFAPEFGTRPDIDLGTTKKQRGWIKRAYTTVWGGLGCAFQIVENEGFVTCSSKENIQIHHITPKAYAYWVLGWDIEQINTPTNLIPLCARHHIGRGYTGTLNWHEELVDVIHPDIEWARRHYKGKRKPTSYDYLFDRRNERLKDKQTYWNTDFDRMLVEIAVETYQRYTNFLTANGLRDPWPVKKRRK